MLVEAGSACQPRNVLGNFTCRSGVASVGMALNALAAPANTASADAVRDGALRGLPSAIKDMFDRRARRGEWGGCRSPGAASSDAALVCLLDEAGANEIAVASMTALAYEPSGYNALRGRTKNPWHPDIITGGSSSGSAALVAAHCAYLGVGSDTGGSIRVPAACCGLVGLKPGWGMLSLDGAMSLSPSLDVIGFMARRSDDLARVWSAIVPQSAETNEINSIAILSSLIDASSSVVRDAILVALRELSELDQHQVSDLHTRTEADRDALTIMQAEAARIHGASSFPEDPALSKRIGKGLSISDAALEAAVGRRSLLREAFLASWGDCDVAALPVMGMPTPLASEVDPRSPEFQARTLYAITAHTRFVNMLGLPAIAVPIGFDERGAPLSMQIVGRPRTEMGLLGLAHKYQSRTTWLERAPPINAL